tara:strand:+ start:4433 stop:5494 length:1062 start_codon:yes stop_codon:yes gene_type:complete
MKRYHRYGKSRKAVLEQLRKLRNDSDKGLLVTAKLTVAEVIEEFIESRELIGRRPKTIQSYRYYSNYYLIPNFGRIVVSQLTRVTIQRFIKTVSKDGVLNAQSIRHCITLLRTALKHAVAKGYIETNPADVLDLPAVAKVEKEPYTTEEARQLIKAIEGHRFEALFATSLTTGLREGEILGLRWADVDLEQGIITVNATLHRRDGSWHWESPKSEESKRVVALIPYTLGLLAKHRESQSAERLVVGEYHPTNNPKGWINQDVVFTTHQGNPLLARNVLREFVNVRDGAGLRRQTYHDLRHATANLLLDTGVSMDDVSKILGHSQYSITVDFYKHLNREARRAAMDKMSTSLAL